MLSLREMHTTHVIGPSAVPLFLGLKLADSFLHEHKSPSLSHSQRLLAYLAYASYHCWPQNHQKVAGGTSLPRRLALNLRCPSLLSPVSSYPSLSSHLYLLAGIYCWNVVLLVSI